MTDVNVWLKEENSKEVLDKARLKYIQETEISRPTNSEVITKALWGYVNGFTNIERRKQKDRNNDTGTATVTNTTAASASDRTTAAAETGRPQ